VYVYGNGPEPSLDHNAELEITSELLRFLSSNKDESNAFVVAEVFVVWSFACVPGIWCKPALGLHCTIIQVRFSRVEIFRCLL
jgi:hypothetical protein